MQSRDYDVLIIGGGPAGATAALLLARAGRSVAIVEKTPFPRRKVCGEFISATGLPLLRKLGVGQSIVERAGPEVKRVGLFARDLILAADMPPFPDGADAYGRALGREHLDTLLLRRAADAGAQVWQPWTVKSVERTGQDFVCAVAERGGKESLHLNARIVIAAHGSWERGTLPTQAPHRRVTPADLFAFKAHFVGAHLERGLMPLFACPGGYGGMVETDGGRVSLSCCIRHDWLERCRHQRPGLTLGAAVLAHICASCRGVREVVGCAKVEGEWLAAGPVRPGIRDFQRDGIYVIGNAAGEAHPIVAEGISMAIQSAWMLCEQLTQEGCESTAAYRYAAEWRRQFAFRVRASKLFARLAVDPIATRAALAVLARMPALLSFGARASGKVQRYQGLAA